MFLSLIFVFVAGYLLIAFEHPLKLNKAAGALLTGVLCWTIYILGPADEHHAYAELLHHLGEIASILFFLLGAMTIVELIDSHEGFSIITRKIRTSNKTRLLWIVCTLTFFLSALLDNLTTAIVMTSLVARLLNDKNDRLWFTGMIVIAANAGGAFSPLGDVTTTMLWIGGQVSAGGIIVSLLLPSIAVAVVPLLIAGYRFRGQRLEREFTDSGSAEKEADLILILGVLLLLLVPVFKLVTGLPPFMGMLFSLAVLWIVVSVIHFSKPEHIQQKYSVMHALQKVDSPSILFFLGILLAVSALQTAGVLQLLADGLTSALGSTYLIGSALGLISAVVDNVPLVAAAQGMYDLGQYPQDHVFWRFLALTTGTGGSAIIIGSAAGVAAMGIEKIEFMWYLRKISLLAIAGFVAGIGVFVLQERILY